MIRNRLFSPLLALILACVAPAKANDLMEFEPKRSGELMDFEPKPEDDLVPLEPAPEEDFELVESYHPSAGAVAGAIAINLVYVPVRFAFTVLGAVVGGLEGIFSVGDVEAVDKIFGLTDGSQIITPAMLEGRERWTFSRYGW